MVNICLNFLHFEKRRTVDSYEGGKFRKKIGSGLSVSPSDLGV